MDADSSIKMGAVICVVGARPNFMKMAPLLRAFSVCDPVIDSYLVHTGQHYDVDMNERIFQDLRLRRPDLNLEVGAGTPTVQTAEVMRRFEPVVDRLSPSAVLVVGDVNSTLACALTAARKSVPVIHVEAGLRSYDRSMPEELNRILTDQLAEILYTTERSASDNLAKEGIVGDRVQFVGNVMIDSLHHGLDFTSPVKQTLARAGANWSGSFSTCGYALVTLHRPSNVDTTVDLTHMLETLKQVASRIPVVFVMHPRTRGNIARFGLQTMLEASDLITLPPQGYLEMLGLTRAATVVLTDSGGLQEETTALGIPCITLRQNTERPITVEYGTNTLVGRDRLATIGAVEQILSSGGKRGRSPELWDGRAASRIAEHLGKWLRTRNGVRR